LFFCSCIFPSTVGLKKEKTIYTPVKSSRYIQNLIDNSSDGDTIYIPNGIYYENIFINKSISLIGENRDTTIIDGGNFGDVIYILANFVNISGFTIQNCGENEYDNGIEIRSKYNIILNNKITENIIGIDINTPGTILRKNFFSNNIKYGLKLGANHANSNIIDSNYFSNCCIYMYGGWHGGPIDNIFINNSILNSGFSIDFHHESNIFINNSVNHKNLIFLYNETNKIINESAGQIYLIDCDNITIQNHDIFNTLDGINLVRSEYCIIKECNISSNKGSGIVIGGFYGVSNNIILENIINSNYKNGIFINNLYSDEDGNEIDSNTLSNNGIGIFLEGNRNIIADNNIFSNRFEGLFIHGDYNKIINNNILYNTENGTRIDGSFNDIINNKIISNFNIGILFGCTSECIISGNNISKNSCGIKACCDGNGNQITKNIIESNLENGLYLENINNIVISGNIIFSNLGNGLYIIHSSKNNIKNNIFSNNKLAGIISIYSNHNNIKGNNITKHYEEGIFILDSINNTIIGNIILENKDGIKLEKSKNNILLDNTIVTGQNGIVVDWYCKNNTIKHNTIKNNLLGLYLFASDSNSIIGNKIVSNKNYGIFLNFSCNNIIFENIFYRNKRNAFFIESKNDWKQNFWNRPRILPKLIIGKIELRLITIPLIDMDWHPAFRPYDI